MLKFCQNFCYHFFIRRYNNTHTQQDTHNTRSMKLVLAAALAGAPLTVAMQNKMEPAINSKIPKNWKNSGAVNPTEQLTLNIALKHSAASISNLEAALLSVSTPASQDYGRHLSREDIMSLLDLPAATTKKALPVESLFLCF